VFRLWFTGYLAAGLGAVLLFMPWFYEEKDARLFTAIGPTFLVVGFIFLGVAYAIRRFRA